MTEPPPRANFSSNVSQWEIYDAYIEDFEEQVFFFFFLNGFLNLVHFSIFIKQKNKEPTKKSKAADSKKVKKAKNSDQVNL